VWIEAPAGMGKTTLIRRFLDHSETRVALWADADETDATQAWAALDRLLARGPGGRRSPAARLRSVLASDAAPSVVTAALVEVLRGLDGDPTVVVLDDVQWIDPPSAQALRLAFRQLERHPVLVVAAARPGAGRDWDRLVASGGRVRRMTLPGLSVEDLALLAAEKGKAIELAAARRLADHTDGNPLHAAALIEELDHAVLANGRGPLPAPRSFTELVVSRLKHCSPPTQALLQGAAVLGSPAHLTSAALLAGLEDPSPALEEAVAANLLIEVAGASDPEVAFTHPLARAAVYHQISRGSRSRLHGQAASVTTGEARVRHRVEAARVSPPQAEALASELDGQARQEMASGALRAAALHFDQAASLTSEGAPRSRRLLGAAEALMASGDAAGARARAQEATGDGPEAGLLVGQLAFFGGRTSVAEESLEAAWAQGDQLGKRALASRAASARAIVAVTRGHTDEVARWATRAGGGPGETAGEGVLAASLGLVMAGRTAEALTGLPETAHDHEWTLARGVLRMWTDDLAGARDDLVAAAALTHEGELVQLASHALAFLAEVEYRSGAWADAIAHGERAAGASVEAGRPWDAAFIHGIAARPLLAMGQWSRAEAHVRAVTEVAESTPVELVVACAARARAAQAMALGNHQAALDGVRLAERALNPGEPAFFPDGPVEALALVALGRLDEAEAALDAFEARGTAVSRRSSLAQAARARGRFKAASGDLEEAQACLVAGLAGLDGLGMPFEVGQLHLDLGRVLSQAGDHGPARDELELARVELVGLEARPNLLACQRLLDELPIPADPRRLTPTQAKVAHLVATGLSNRQVAERLSLSTKTVDCHLYRVFKKLQISHRTELGSRLTGSLQ